MLKIGEFSKLSRVSVRMLRHYDEIGLLKPAEIDRFTECMKKSPGHRQLTDDREFASSLVPVVNHALFVGTLTGQPFISSHIYR